jgi:hypothetical protein
MSQEWRKKIYDAAVSCSDENIFELLQQIPDGYAPIIRVFRDLANNYEFEKIMELTRSNVG